MASPVRSKDTASPGAPTKIPGAWLDARDKRLVAWGVIGSIVVAVGLGLAIVVLGKLGNTVLDPDAQTLVIPPDYPRQLADFSLVDESRHVLQRSDLRGKIVVVDFIFTGCTLTCPYVNAELEKIQDATTQYPNVRLLSLTLDPTDDTPEVLAAYAPKFGADPQRWLFLTGDAPVMQNLVATSFLPPDSTGEFAYMPGNFSHTQRIALVDQSGRLVSYYDGMNKEAAAAVIDEIRKLEATP